MKTFININLHLRMLQGASLHVLSEMPEHSELFGINQHGERKQNDFRIQVVLPCSCTGLSQMQHLARGIPKDKAGHVPISPDTTRPPGL